MNRKSKTAFLFLALLVTTIGAREKVVYGEDSRAEVYQHETPLYQEWGRSIAGMVEKSRFEKDLFLAQNEVRILSDDLPFSYCSDDPFAQQQTAPICTGFLVGEDLLLTAGHCVEIPGEDACRDYSWVFELDEGKYLSHAGEEKGAIVKDSSVYECKEVVFYKLDGEEDFAIVKLDRPVDNRTPLDLRLEGAVSKRDPLVVIGHPLGLSQKVADNAYVRDIQEEYVFKANVDSFVGNSGSPVFNGNTGEVEGILVRGENDFVFDREKGCERVKNCAMDDCRGEDVMRIDYVMPYLQEVKSRAKK